MLVVARRAGASQSQRGLTARYVGQGKLENEEIRK